MQEKETIRITTGLYLKGELIAKKIEDYEFPKSSGLSKSPKDVVPIEKACIEHNLPRHT